MNDQKIMTNPLLRYAAAMGTGISLNELESECRARGFAPLPQEYPLEYNGKTVYWTKYREFVDAFPALTEMFDFQPTTSVFGGMLRARGIDQSSLSTEAQLAEIKRQIENDACPSD